MGPDLNEISPAFRVKIKTNVRNSKWRWFILWYGSHSTECLATSQGTRAGPAGDETEVEAEEYSGSAGSCRALGLQYVLKLIVE